jgi:hypothetical protein
MQAFRMGDARYLGLAADRLGGTRAVSFPEHRVPGRPFSRGALILAALLSPLGRD